MSKATNEAIPTQEQLAALQRFANENGRTWKAELSSAWASGKDEKLPDAAHLRAIRNQLGPQWLYSSSNPIRRGVEIQAEVAVATATHGAEVPVVENTIARAVVEGSQEVDSTKEKGATAAEERSSEQESEQVEAGMEDAILPATRVASGGDVADAILPATSSKAVDRTQRANPKAAEQQREAAPRTLLHGRFVRDEKGDYRRLGEMRTALSDEGERIRFVDKQMDAFEAGVELAKAKGWEAIQVTGTEKFRAEAWFHAHMEGLQVIGYEPTQRDLERLEASQSRTEKSASEAVADVDESRRKAEAFVLGAGGGVHAADIERGRYAGPVMHETEHHFVQDLGRGTAVVHDKSRFPAQEMKERLRLGKSLRVQYQGGRAQTEPGREQFRGVAMGR